MDVKTQSDGSAAMQSQSSSSQEERKETPASFALFLLKLLLAVLMFRIFVFSPFSIPSESMVPRLINGDYLLAAKWSYGYSNNSLPMDVEIFPGRIFASEPERGDIAIFKHPVDGTDYIKRVIALPGDSVAVVDGQILLNGELIPREPLADFEIEISPNTGCAWGGEQRVNEEGVAICSYTRFRETLPGGPSYEVLDFGTTPADDFAPKIIPEGHMFVLGDNRDNSRDSRFEARAGDAVGIVPQENLVGEATIIMWSTDGSAEWIKPWTWFTAARWGRIGGTL
ncbi:signal peptidase I [Erythrobacter sp. KY5]|uniref:signal peptidase I n=1 Tax=Erythrobacter sp. KY5 TaxID=2011159 RepID=UPI000DBF33EA|nr:signal peptidase I [Erythrobacter sp. KY5]AWW74503.1 signal peptidase I [Erythrobacter sp. KY5]